MERYEDEVDQDDMEIIEGNVQSIGLKNERTMERVQKMTTNMVHVRDKSDDEQGAYKRQRMAFNEEENHQHLPKDNKLK